MNLPSVRSKKTSRGLHGVAVRKVSLPAPVSVSNKHRIPWALRSRMMFLPGCNPSSVAGMHAGLSIGLTLLIARGATQFERVVDPEFAGGFGVQLAVLWVVLVGYLMGVGTHFLDALLALSKASKIDELGATDFSPRPAFKSLFRWLVCFACGPAAVFVAAAHYWLYCGDPNWIDYLILAELIVPSLMYALLGVLVLSDHPEQLLPRPRQVLQMVQRLGLMGILTCAGISLAAVLLFSLAAFAIALLQSDLFVGLLLLWICWFGVWLSAAMTLQMLGGWYHQTRKRRRKIAAAVADL